MNSIRYLLRPVPPPPGDEEAWKEYKAICDELDRGAKTEERIFMVALFFWWIVMAFCGGVVLYLRVGK
jgi:hypothetical protein